MHRGRPLRARRTRGGVAAGTLAALLALSACSGEDGPAEPSTDPTRTAESSATAPAAPAVTTQATMRKITGKLDAAAEAELTAQVGAIVDGWFQAAYLAGEFPRTAPYTAADFPGFTAGAAELAAKDDFLSNRAIAGQIDGVTPVSASAALDVLAVRGRAQGVTAKVDLVFETTGAVAGTERVRGHLDLAPQKGEWKVFGYEIKRTSAAGGAQ